MHSTLPSSIRTACETRLDAKIQSVESVGGGDINEARLLRTSRGSFFLKMNTGAEAGRMFETEARGLALLSAPGVIRIPEVIGHGTTADGAWLILEYIPTGYRPPGFWEEFGTSLAALHRETADRFGLDHDNFIGSLEQGNPSYITWPEFYIHARLGPQLEMALSDGQLTVSDAKCFEKLYQKLGDICPAEPPALTHGDLWSGNFLAGDTGEPVLIDPAVSYAHREMDLGMSRLFGGFDRDFYRYYEESYPLAPGFEQRLPVYQLYYLMVHVNLFGGGYVGSVRRVLEQFA